MRFFSLERTISAYRQIMPYLGQTLGFVVVSLILTTVLAVILALLRLKRIVGLNQILGAYISFVRGTPILVQIMLVFYGMPKLVMFFFHVNIVRWEAIVFAVIAVVLNESAFFSEQVRGAILSIPVTQMEAGYSVGMTKLQVYWRIIFPQVIRILIPTYGNVVLGIFMETSVLYMVGITDIMSRASSIAKSSGHSFDGYIVVAAIYIIVNLGIRALFHCFEKKFQYGRG